MLDANTYEDLQRIDWLEPCSGCGKTVPIMDMTTGEYWAICDPCAFAAAAKLGSEPSATQAALDTIIDLSRKFKSVLSVCLLLITVSLVLPLSKAVELLP